MDILEVTEELKSLAETGTRVPGFRRKVLVDTDRLMALGEELRSSVPANMEEAKEILNQKESIINLAYLEAKRIKSAAEQEVSAITAAARHEHETKVDETEIVKAAEVKGQEIRDEAMAEAEQIVQEAQRRAYRILNEAETVANNRRDGADQYAREVLFSLEEQLAELLGRVRRGIDSLRSEDTEGQQVNGPAPEQVPA